jgi:Kyakuja-Dileera-Zisupton transposase
MNMDYTLCQALQNTNIGEIKNVIVYYDINCQYSKKLQARVERNAHLYIPAHMKIIPGIGLLHVTEHKPECVPRYAPTYIEGAGLVAGEIIESLWSGLNGCTASTRTATQANRAEMLDDHMNDSNWSKLLNIVETICKQYTKAIAGLPMHKAEFEEQTSIAGPENVKKWSMQTQKAQKNRTRYIEAMDIYLATAQTGKPTSIL